MLLKTVGALASFLTTVMISRWFGASTTGIYALVTQTVVTFAAFAVLGNDQLLVRRIAGELRVNQLGLAYSAYYNGRRVVTLLGLAIASCTLLISLFWNFIGIDIYINVIISTGILLYAWLTVDSAALRASSRLILAQFLSQSLGPLLFLAILIPILFCSYNINAVTLSGCYLIALAIPAGVARITMQRMAAFWQTPCDAAQYRWWDSWPIGLSIASQFATSWFLLVLISTMQTSAEVGIFRVALQIMMLLQMLMATLEGFAAPRFAADFRVDDVASIRRRFFLSIGALLLTCSPLLFICLIAPQWIMGIFGQEFIAGAPVVQILAGAQLLNILSGPSGSLIIMAGREHTNCLLSLMSLIIAIGVALWLLPIFGIVGAAFALATSMTFRNFAHLTVVFRIVRRKSL